MKKTHLAVQHRNSSLSKCLIEVKWIKVVNPIINLQFGWFILFIQPMSGIPLGCGIMAEVLSLPSLPGRSKLLMALATAAKEVDRDSLRLSGFVTS